MGAADHVRREEVRAGRRPLAPPAGTGREGETAPSYENSLSYTPADGERGGRAMARRT